MVWDLLQWLQIVIKLDLMCLAEFLEDLLRVFLTSSCLLRMTDALLQQLLFVVLPISPQLIEFNDVAFLELLFIFLLWQLQISEYFLIILIYGWFLDSMWCFTFIWYNLLFFLPWKCALCYPSIEFFWLLPLLEPPIELSIMCEKEPNSSCILPALLLALLVQLQSLQLGLPLNFHGRVQFWWKDVDSILRDTQR